MVRAGSNESSTRIRIAQRIDGSRVFLFSSIRKVPPFPRPVAVHEINSRHETIEHAGVMKPAIGSTDFSIELERILSNQSGGGFDADPDEIVRDRRSDIHDLPEVSN